MITSQGKTSYRIVPNRITSYSVPLAGQSNPSYRVTCRVISYGIISYGMISCGLNSCGITSCGLISLGTICYGIVPQGKASYGIFRHGNICRGIIRQRFTICITICHILSIGSQFTCDATVAFDLTSLSETIVYPKSLLNDILGRSRLTHVLSWSPRGTVAKFVNGHQTSAASRCRYTSYLACCTLVVWSTGCP